MLINEDKMKDKAAKFIEKEFKSGVDAGKQLDCTRANISLVVTKQRAPSKKILKAMGYQKVNMYKKVK